MVFGVDILRLSRENGPKSNLCMTCTDSVESADYKIACAIQFLLRVEVVQAEESVDSSELEPEPDELSSNLLKQGED